MNGIMTSVKERRIHCYQEDKQSRRHKSYKAGGTMKVVAKDISLHLEDAICRIA